MPNPHKWSGLLIAATLLAAPAFADGKDTGRPVQGPEPLKPHAQTCVPELKGHDACPTHTVKRKVYRKRAPVRTQRVVRKAAAPVARYDFSGFNGGVGARVDGGYYGGNGAFIVTGSSPRYSGVLSSRAAAFTFRHKAPRPSPKPRPTPCCAMR